jgi:hypothetical protein
MAVLHATWLVITEGLDGQVLLDPILGSIVTNEQLSIKANSRWP